MTMATKDSVYNNIASTCFLTDIADIEQVLDIVISREEQTANKYDDYSRITAEWDSSQWKSVLREFYVSYQKVKLCDLSFIEIDPNMRPEPMIEAQKSVSQFKKGPDAYYTHMVNYELDRPSEGTPLTDSTPVLVSIYAAISSGENYGSVFYPPTRFIEEVVGQGITKQDFYATVLKEIAEPVSFESKVIQAAQDNKQLANQMKAAYKQLVGRDMATVLKNTASVVSNAVAATTVTAEHATRKGKKIAGVIKAATLTEDDNKISQKNFNVAQHTGHVKIFSKYGIIMLVINGLALPTKWVLGVAHIKTLASAGFFKAFTPTIVTTVGCFIPVVGVVCMCAMLFVGIVPTKDSRKRLAYILLCVGILCTLYSALALVKTVLAVITAFVTKSFTISNIAEAASKGIFDAFGGLVKGTWKGVTGLFK